MIIKNIKLLILSIIINFVLISLTSAATIVTGWTISSNTTWTTWNTYHVTSNLSINSWVLFTIQEWVVIKIDSWRSIAISWNLQAIWTLWNEIIFTSKNDDSVWDTIVWSSWSPSPWDWLNFSLNWAWSDLSVLDYLEIKYWWATTAWLLFNVSDSTISNSLITDSATKWIWSYSSNPLISYTTVNNSGSDGIHLYTWAPLLFDNNMISNSGWHWLNIWTISIDITNSTMSWSTLYGIYSTSYTSTYLNNQVLNNGNPIYSENVEPYLVWSNTTITWNIWERLWISFEMVSTSWTIKNYAWHNYHVISSKSIDSWETLTIEPWNIFKVDFWRNIQIAWNLQAIWTELNPIIFTSYNDNSVWDTEWTWTPSPWDWSYIIINSSWSDATVLDYVEIRYWWATSAWIQFNTSDSTISNSIITDSATKWIYTYSSNLSISNTSINNSWTDWLHLYNWVPTLVDNNIITNSGWHWLNMWGISVDITNNTFSWSTLYWIYSTSYTATFSNNEVLNNGSAIYSENVEPYLISSNTTITWNTSERLWISFEMVWLTWTIKNYPWHNYHVISSKSIDSWETLTIEPWNIFKVASAKNIVISWNLQAIWTELNPIIFTSYNDNSVWDTDGTGTPSTWDWSYFMLAWAWSDASVLNYVEFKYWWATSAWLYINTSDLVLANILVMDSATKWIYTYSSNVSISSTTINNSWTDWLHLYTWTPVLIDNNTITNSGGHWLNIWSITIDVTNNTFSWSTLYWIYSTSYTSTFSNNQVINNGNAIYSKSVEPYLIWSNTTITWNIWERLWIAFEMVWLTWTLKKYSWHNYHVIDSKSIDLWETLTIEPWNIFKVDSWKNISISWNLQAIWTALNPIIFTSYNDNSVWDTDWTWFPTAWDWAYFMLAWAWSDASVLDYVEFNYWWTTSAWLHINTSDPIISNISVKDSATKWIYTYLSDLAISNTTVTNSLTDWIHLYSWNPTLFDNNTMTNNNWNGLNMWALAVDITNSTFSWNTLYWVYTTSDTATYSNNQVINNGSAIYSKNVEPYLIWSNTIITWNTSARLWIAFEMVWITWTIKNYSWYNYHVIDSRSIDSWETLTIEAWNIFKVASAKNISISWNLQAIWVSWNPIIFTSYNDNSVWDTDWTWLPVAWDWAYFMLAWVGSSSSVLDYVEIIYWWATTAWLHFNTTDATISNSLIANNATEGIYVYIWNSTIKNNIFYKNWLHWFRILSWTSNATNNLYYLNTSWSSNILLDIDSIEADPLFIDEVDYELQATSPAINTWDLSYWNHPISGDRYDIWVSEYNWAWWWSINLNYWVSLTGTDWRDLTYEWLFTSLPWWASTPPMTNSTWNIISDWAIANEFTITKIGNYTIKFIVKELGTIVWEGINNFTINN